MTRLQKTSLRWTWKKYRAVAEDREGQKKKKNKIKEKNKIEEDRGKERKGQAD